MPHISNIHAYYVIPPGPHMYITNTKTSNKNHPKCRSTKTKPQYAVPYTTIPSPSHQPAGISSCPLPDIKASSNNQSSPIPYRLLGIRNLAPVVLTAASPASDPRWSAVDAGVVRAQWSPEKPVVLTPYMDQLKPVYIPQELRQPASRDSTGM